MPLSQTQRQVLEAALGHPERLVVHFPAHLKGGARGKVLAALISAGFITQHPESSADMPIYAVSQSGLAVLGIEAPAPQTGASNPYRPNDRSAAGGLREGTKQATLIALLKQAHGASLSELAQASGWQAHTIRGFMAGSLKKKLGLTVTSDKAEGQERRYRIA